MGCEGLSSLPAQHSREPLIAKLERTIVEAWSPEGIDGKTLAPGQELGAKRVVTVSPKGGSAASN